jgi:hypothetical protein
MPNPAWKRFPDADSTINQDPSRQPVSISRARQVGIKESAVNLMSRLYVDFNAMSKYAFSKHH